MPVNKQQKEEILSTLKDRFSRMKAAVFTANGGMTVKSVSTLRNKLRAEGMDYQVAKKTLINLAAEGAKIKDFDLDSLEGSVAVAFGYEDEVSTAKLIKQFAKSEEKITIVAGIMDGRFLTKVEVEQLAALPSKSELYSKVLATMNGPLSGFVRCCTGNISAFARVINAYKEKLAS
ncbi:MAG: 50S ribosomal protein L10 [Candidatus Gracilibacteria bacterium]|nr:50S ribosomal protein L10 [Candidatus Gracilibacteria bacterium]